MTEVIRTELHDIQSKVAFFKPLVNLIRIFLINFIAYPTVKGVIKTWKTEKFQKKKFFHAFLGPRK